jgi:hypothetical protein
VRLFREDSPGADKVLSVFAYLIPSFMVVVLHPSDSALAYYRRACEAVCMVTRLPLSPHFLFDGAVRSRMIASTPVFIRF